MICGGGTAGHIYPGLALAESLSQLVGDSRIHFVGAAEGLEARLVPESGRHLLTLNVRGLPRRPSPRALYSLLLMARAYWKAKRLVKEYRPAVVVGMGGYASLPVGMAAHSLGVPVVIHEQNAVPGLANRLLAKRAAVIALTYEESRRFFPDSSRVVLTGNPVRGEIAPLEQAKARGRLGLDPDRTTILVLGGSRGARKLNQAALELYDLVRDNAGIQILLISGTALHGEVEESVSRLRRVGDKILLYLLPYLDEISLAYSAADIVVSRAGSGGIAEMTVCGKPGVLVPYPFATGAHQEANADALVAAGAAVKLDNDTLSGKLLWETIDRLLAEESLVAKMSEAARRWAKPGAAMELARLVTEIALGGRDQN